MSSRPDAGEWLAMSEDREFCALVRSKRRVLLSSWLLVVISFFGLSAGIALAPGWFAQRVVGEINIALLLALAEVALVLLVAAFYVRRASRDFDRRAEVLGDRFFAARRS